MHNRAKMQPQSSLRRMGTFTAVESPVALKPTVPFSPIPGMPAIISPEEGGFFSDETTLLLRQQIPGTPVLDTTARAESGSPTPRPYTPTSVVGAGVLEPLKEDELGTDRLSPFDKREDAASDGGDSRRGSDSFVGPRKAASKLLKTDLRRKSSTGSWLDKTDRSSSSISNNFEIEVEFRNHMEVWQKLRKSNNLFLPRSKLLTIMAASGDRLVIWLTENVKEHAPNRHAAVFYFFWTFW